VCCSWFLVLNGIWSWKKKVDFDYSYYLGEDYIKKMKPIKKTSTIICNHVTWLDPVVLLVQVFPAFAPNEDLRRVPLVSNLIEALGSIYIPRGGTEEKRI